MGSDIIVSLRFWCYEVSTDWRIGAPTVGGGRRVRDGGDAV
jgi:hypothetical protein